MSESIGGGMSSELRRIANGIDRLAKLTPNAGLDALLDAEISVRSSDGCLMVEVNYKGKRASSLTSLAVMGQSHRSVEDEVRAVVNRVMNRVVLQGD